MSKKLLTFIFGMIFLISILSSVSAVVTENILAVEANLSNDADLIASRGVNITMKANETSITVTKISTSNASRAWLYTASGGYLANGSFSANNATISYDFINGTSYLVMIDSAGAPWNVKYGEAYGFPTVRTTLDFVTGIYFLTGYGNGSAQSPNTDTNVNSILKVWTDDAPPDNPSVTLNYPTNNSIITNSSIDFTASFNITSSSNNYVWKNATYNIWYSNGTLFNSTIVTLTELENTTNTLQINNFAASNYLYGITAYINNGSSSKIATSSNNSLYVGSNVTGYNYNNNTYETSSETYKINITAFDALTPSNAKLNWNGTNYTATTTSIDGTNYTLSSTIQIPKTNSSYNATFSFYWDIDSSTEVSSTYNQTVNPIMLSICNATYTIPFINFTFKDESNLSLTSAAIPTSTFVYWLGNGTVNKTLTYSNTSENSNYTFCFSPVNNTVSVDIRMQYSGADYPQRIYDPTSMNFTNSTYNKTLYMLSTSDGQYVTFQVVNLAEQTISNVEVNATRDISGSDVVVGQGTTGDDGTVTLWLNPNFIHTFGFFKTGITTLITSFAPTQTSYTITMNTGTTVTDNDYVKGIKIQIKPTQTSLSNGTVYNFNMTLNSSYWVVSLFGFTLEDVNGNVLNSSSSIAGSGTVSATWNTSNYTKVYMKYYYVINSTYTNYSRAWTIYDSETGLGFGLATFFTDLRNYFTTGDGLFGSTEFALAIITFLAIFLITGVFAYSFGISSPATISGLIFGLVLFFDVGVGLLPNVNDNHAITLIMAIITIALFAREVSR